MNSFNNHCNDPSCEKSHDLFCEKCKCLECSQLNNVKSNDNHFNSHFRYCKNHCDNHCQSTKNRWNQKYCSLSAMNQV